MGKEKKFVLYPHGFSYRVDKTTVIVRNRIRSLEPDQKKFYKEDRADAYLAVTDTFTVAPQGTIFVWFPWNEGRQPIPELYYATNRVLSWWIFYQKLKKVVVYCDGGTHRSVTVFGAYLRTYHTREEAQRIVDKRKEVNGVEGRDSRSWAQPLEYIDSYLDELPADRLLFRAMKGDRLGRLDNHSRQIYQQVKERYGDWKG